MAFRCEFIPVLALPEFKHWWQGDLPPLWRSDAPVQYKNWLLSVAYLSKQIEAYLNSILPELEEVKKDGEIFFDSSGFQAATGRLRLNPKEVIRKQLKFANVGPILDIPPYGKSAENAIAITEFKLKRFEECLEQTKGNARIAMEEWKKSGKDFRLLGVLQGHTARLRDVWFNGLSEVGEFSGWAYAPKPSSNPLQVLSGLFYLVQKGVTRIHAFALAGPKSVLVLFYALSMLGKDLFITFDAASAAILAKKRQYVLPMSIEEGEFGSDSIYMGEQKGTADLPFIESIYCPCPVCQKWGTHYLVFGDGKSPTPFELIMQHNLWWLIKRFEYFRSLGLEELERLVLKQNKLGISTVNAVKLFCRKSVFEVEQLLGINDVAGDSVAGRGAQKDLDRSIFSYGSTKNEDG